MTTRDELRARARQSKRKADALEQPDVPEPRLRAQKRLAPSRGMTDEPVAASPGALKCPRCREGILKLLTVLPSFRPNPKYSIYRCLSCGFVDWVAEQIGGINA